MLFNNASKNPLYHKHELINRSAKSLEQFLLSLKIRYKSENGTTKILLVKYLDVREYKKKIFRTMKNRNCPLLDLKNTKVSIAVHFFLPH